MSKSIDRKRVMARYALPAESSQEYQRLIAKLSKLDHHKPGLDKFIREQMNKGVRTVQTQGENGANLIMDAEIRHFLFEFNGRIMSHGMRSMPSSYNVMEAFFDYKPDTSSFVLLEEENYMLSFYDFIDFITSREFVESKEKISDYLVEDLICHYDISNEVQEIIFDSEDGNKFLIGGVSIVRRGSEAIVFILGGTACDIEKETKNIKERSKKYVSKKGREGIKPSDDYEAEAVKLFDIEGYWKTYAYCRIDLEKQTIDARYVQSDEGKSLSTITDDRDMIFDREGNFKDSFTQELYTDMAKRVSNYSPIFEIATKCLYLPYYFETFNDKIKIEEHPTLLSSRKSKPLFRKEKVVSSAYKIFSRDVYYLDTESRPAADTIYFGESEYQIERSGYWKTLDHNELGKDKNGKPIHGKTWVDQLNTWYEPRKQGLSIHLKRRDFNGANAGWIYLMRNASHGIDIHKIGLTRRDPQTRASELSATSGAADKFLIAEQWEVKDCLLAEKMIHLKLDNNRINDRREFFKIGYKEAIHAIQEIVDKINMA